MELGQRGPYGTLSRRRASKVRPRPWLTKVFLLSTYGMYSNGSFVHLGARKFCSMSLGGKAERTLDIFRPCLPACHILLQW